MRKGDLVIIAYPPTIPCHSCQDVYERFKGKTVKFLENLESGHVHFICDGFLESIDAACLEEPYMKKYIARMKSV